MNATITNEFRIEEDYLGDVHVPADHLWDVQTQRSRPESNVDEMHYGYGVV